MTSKEKQAVCDKLDWEGGMDYFYMGSRFEEVKDAKFHKLREQFVKSYRALAKYIGLE